MSNAQIWFNGEFRKSEECTVHIYSHALHYGSSVFEGISERKVRGESQRVNTSASVRAALVRCGPAAFFARYRRLQGL